MLDRHTRDILFSRSLLSTILCVAAVVIVVVTPFIQDVANEVYVAVEGVVGMFNVEAAADSAAMHEFLQSTETETAEVRKGIDEYREVCRCQQRLNAVKAGGGFLLVSANVGPVHERQLNPSTLFGHESDAPAIASDASPVQSSFNDIGQRDTNLRPSTSSSSLGSARSARPRTARTPGSKRRPSTVSPAATPLSMCKCVQEPLH